jgi:hypothetical protein
MRNKTLLILCLILSDFNLFSQTVIKGFVRDSSSKLPVQNAAVYLSRTTIGTYTDQEGFYTLLVPVQGQFELTVSFIGYKSVSAIVYARGGRQNFDISIAPDPVLLNEVTVRSKFKNRIIDYSDFVRLFIGESENAQSCKIKNPSDMRLFRDPENKFLRGHSVKPLIIENKALGYTVLYDLVDFDYNIETGNCRFSGYTQFKPENGSKARTRKWSRNRLTAFYGSRTDFLRSLFADSLSSANFTVLECGIDTVDNAIININPVSVNSFRLSEDQQYLSVFDKSPLLITYTDNHPELSTSILGFQPREYKSVLSFNDTIRVFRNGYYYNPYSATWTGNMSGDRIADMLPYDFSPNSGSVRVAVADTATSFIDKFVDYRQALTPDEQVFIHTDRNRYRVGDTIYFQSYIRNLFTNSFECSVASLYVMLFNDQNQKADSARFRILNATAPGWLVIPADAKPGTYHLTAFTSRLQNFDPQEAFHLDLQVSGSQNDKLNIQVQFNKALYQPGDTLEAELRMSDRKGNPASQQSFKCNFFYKNSLLDSDESKTSRQGASFIRFVIPDTIHFISQMQIALYNNKKEKFQVRNFSIPFSDDIFDLRFLPEGGNYVQGIEQKIVVVAADKSGEPVHLEGLLKKSDGTVIDTVRSGPWGPGEFYCKPEKGLFLELIKGQRQQKIFPLPDPLPSGYSVSIVPLNKRAFALDVKADSYKGDTIIATGIMNLAKIFENRLIMNREQRMVIKTDDLPEGIAEIIVFDSGMRPLSSRLVSVNADEHLHFSVTTDKKEYEAGDETEITVNASDMEGNPPKGIFSISVYDSLSGHAPELFMPGIEYTFFYNPSFPSNLPSQVLEKGLENLPDDQRDLMLRTYGWSRFNWNTGIDKTLKKEETDYDQFKMKLVYTSSNRLINRKLDLVSLEGPSVMHLNTDNAGEVSFPLSALPLITKSVMIMPDTKGKERVHGAMFSIPYNEQYFKNKGISIPGRILYPELERKISILAKPELSERTIELPEVKVSATRKIGFINKYEEMFFSGNVRSAIPKQLWSTSTLETAIRQVINPFMITNDAVIFHPPHSFFGGGIPALIVLDGMPIYASGWAEVKSMSPSLIASLTILDGPQGSIYYGLDAAGGVIFINSFFDNKELERIKTEWRMENDSSKMLIPVRLFRPNVEFYAPVKAQEKNDPYVRVRPTVFWDPEVYFDGLNAVKIKYVNPLHGARMRIVINGVSLSNEAGNFSGSYNVKENPKY